MPARVCFGSKNSFARGPASSNCDARLRTDFDPLGDADVVANRVAERGGEARFAECGCVHRKRTIASTCAERMRRRVVSG